MFYIFLIIYFEEWIVQKILINGVAWHFSKNLLAYYFSFYTP